MPLRGFESYYFRMTMQSPLGPNNYYQVYPNYQWVWPSTNPTKKIVKTEYEYDHKGRIVKVTVTEETVSYPQTYGTYTSSGTQVQIETHKDENE